MLPILLAIGPLKIYTMGVFIVLGLFWSFFLIWKLIRLTSFKEEDVFDVVISSIFGGLLGARILYVVLRNDLFGFDVIKIIFINGYPGLAFWGGIFGFVLLGSLTARYKKIQWYELLDYIVLGLLLFSVFVSLGGLFSGSFIGSITTFPLSMKYSGIDGIRHFVGLYAFALYTGGVFISYRLLQSVRRGEVKKGSVLFFGLGFIGLVNLLLDKVKEHTLYLFGLRFDTIIGLILVLTVSIYFTNTFKKNIITFIKYYAKEIKIKTAKKFKRKTVDEATG
jgi:prolipoprotein diacylglyceryltransferase